MPRTRSRLAVLVGLVAALCASGTKVRAHGGAPEATGLLAAEGDQATLVRLSRGLAHRVEEGFRFLCPETWGGDVTAAMAGIGGGALVAGAELFVVESDGRVSAHPSQAGMGVALASHGDGAYGIFVRDGQRELRRVTRTSNELVRNLDAPFTRIAASEDLLWLLGFLGEKLFAQSTLPSGELGQLVMWSSPSVVARAELRIAAGTLYVSIWGSAAPWVTLGQVIGQDYETLRDAHSDIAGPIALGNMTYALIDGVLEQLAERLPVGQRANLNCLETQGALPYACAQGALARVEPTGLAAPLFGLTSLREPDYVGLDEVQRADCKVRWLDLRDHVAEASQTNAASKESVADAGMLRGALPDASSVVASPEADDDSSGCRVGASGARGDGRGWLALLLLVVARRRTIRNLLLPMSCHRPIAVGALVAVARPARELYGPRPNKPTPRRARDAACDAVVLLAEVLPHRRRRIAHGRNCFAERVWGDAELLGPVRDLVLLVQADVLRVGRAAVCFVVCHASSLATR